MVSLIAASVILLGCLPSLVNAQSPANKKDPVEQSVDRALRFLANLQEPDGAWQAFGTKNPAVTSLCLMAFLSAGHVPGEGPYAEVVDRGLRWVLRSHHAQGLIGADSKTDMYHQGICTLLLAEACGMTNRQTAAELRPALEKGVRTILQGQRTAQGPHRGGWRYFVDSPDADLSVSGWQILALRAARNLGCDVPADRIDMAIEFLLRCRDPRTGAFCYQPGGHPTLACTGTGILALELCGKDRHHSHEALQGGGHLLKNPPQWTDPHFFYTAYYCSQAMFQLGGNYWDFYRPRLHQVLFDRQQSNGAWIGTEPTGPPYCTSMAVLALTVEYRYLPIYQRDEGVGKK